MEVKNRKSQWISKSLLYLLDKQIHGKRRKKKKRRKGQETKMWTGDGWTHRWSHVGNGKGKSKSARCIEEAYKPNNHVSGTDRKKRRRKKKSVPHDCTQKKADGIVEQASKGGIANLISCLMNEGSIKNL